MATDARLQVTVLYSPAARDVREVVLDLAPHSTVLQALQASGLLRLFPGLDQPATKVGIWRRRVSLDRVLQQHDRVEFYRELMVDPKVARRARFAQQGARTTGLFLKKRPGAKAGY